MAGRIKESSGFALAGVKVTVTCNGDSRQSDTDTEGRYLIQDLQPGSCEIRAELSRFLPVTKRAFQILPGENELDFTLNQISLMENIVVTPSRTETELIQAPAAVTILDDEVIENSPAQNYADLLRNVPGLNVIQTSARDVNLTSREATGLLSTSQLVMLDDRTLYLDFFGFVAWDFVPINFNEIKRIEVIRGPASAVWGANAQTGVVNIITKEPREVPGVAVNISGGFVDRNIESTMQEEDSGGLFGTNVRFADMIDDQLSYKISAGYFTQSAFTRPAGRIPIDTVPGTNFPTGGGLYPAFPNSATDQFKLDFRLDQEFGIDSRIVYAAGVAETSGILHGSFGPNQLENGSFFGYGKVSYTR
ncbi:TonB-dependent receptor, partial [bacterium]|nr:TonB-dependent receptor [bacterium]